MSGAALAFRQRVRGAAFEATLVDASASERDPLLPDLGVFAPLDAPDVAVWAELPAWSRVRGDPQRADGLARRHLAAVFAVRRESGEPIYSLRCVAAPVRNAAQAGAVSAAVVVPHQVRVELPPTDAIGGKTVTFVGYVDHPRTHAKAFKHVLGIAYRDGTGDLAPALGPDRAPSLRALDLEAAAEAGCALACERLAGRLREQDDLHRDHCQRCAPRVFLRVEEEHSSVGDAVDALREATRDAFGRACERGTVAAFPEGNRGAGVGLGCADDQGVVVLTRALGARSRHEAVTTYLASGQDVAERRARADARLEKSVRDDPTSAFLRRRDA